MGNLITEIPEVFSLGSRDGLIRIPPELDVPVTPRVRRLMDTEAFRRLSRISQLGLVSTVYPAANHTRFEHSLGVYRTSLQYLRQLSHDPRFIDVVSRQDAERFMVSALLHDLGHWPFCHPLEDIRDPRVPRHELLAEEFLSGEISDALASDWGLEPANISSLLSGSDTSGCSRLLASLLSGPIDVDKMDYLRRDSLHAGVPYGQNFDRSRLIGSLCLNEAGDALAITDKGRTAAEMMVFARYVMFSEVYWHHAVRSATAMLQRAFYVLLDELDAARLFRQTEAEMTQQLLVTSKNTRVAKLIAGLFGPKRRLYKRLEQYSLFQQPELYSRLAGQPYPWLVACAEALAEQLSSAMGSTVDAEQILIDAPPVKREIEINIDVYFLKEGCYRPLAEVSPVVQTLAKEQFDDYVKRVRVFIAPELRDRAKAIKQLPNLLNDAIDVVNSARGRA